MLHSVPATDPAPPLAPAFVALGENPARVFGLDARQRAERLAANAGLEVRRNPTPDGAQVLADLGYAWDPAWLKAIAARPGTVLTLGGQPILAHLPGGQAAQSVVEAMRRGAPAQALDPGLGLELLAAETGELNYAELRKRGRPFAMPLEPATAQLVERAAYDAAYKGVTDLLTLYLWRRPAFHLTRWAAAAGITPNAVTLVGFVFCLAAFGLFWTGHYWSGLASGFVFMVLDTVDGKLARCTGQSSKWGNVLDHGVDLVHPPFWWWAWVHGLSAVGLALEPVYAMLVIGAIVAGYVLQRAIEGIFLTRFKIDPHVWQPFDSRFRLITARRNPNMLILFGSLIARRPDVGIELVALWTLLSLIVHAVRLAQANSRAEQGAKITSWLA
jgi:phosphatidylglycerophosphate synthase